jgi:hypothetical protein
MRDRLCMGKSALLALAWARQKLGRPTWSPKFSLLSTNRLWDCLVATRRCISLHSWLRRDGRQTVHCPPFSDPCSSKLICGTCSLTTCS